MAPLFKKVRKKIADKLNRANQDVKAKDAFSAFLEDVKKQPDLYFNSEMDAFLIDSNGETVVVNKQDVKTYFSTNLTQHERGFKTKHNEYAQHLINFSKNKLQNTLLQFEHSSEINLEDFKIAVKLATEKLSADFDYAIRNKTHDEKLKLRIEFNKLQNILTELSVEKAIMQYNQNSIQNIQSEKIQRNNVPAVQQTEEKTTDKNIVIIAKSTKKAEKTELQKLAKKKIKELETKKTVLRLETTSTLNNTKKEKREKIKDYSDKISVLKNFYKMDLANNPDLATAELVQEIKNILNKSIHIVFGEEIVR